MADLKTNQQLLCRLSALQRHQQADNDYDETSEEDLQVPESEHCIETLPETVYKKNGVESLWCYTIHASVLKYSNIVMFISLIK